MTNNTLIWYCDDCPQCETDNITAFCKRDQIDIPSLDIEFNSAMLHNSPNMCEDKCFIIADFDNNKGTKGMSYKEAQARIRKHYGDEVDLQFVTYKDSTKEPIVKVVESNPDSGEIKVDVTVPLEWGNLLDVLDGKLLKQETVDRNPQVDFEEFKGKFEQYFNDWMERNPTWAKKTESTLEKVKENISSKLDQLTEMFVNRNKKIVADMVKNHEKFHIPKWDEEIVIEDPNNTPDHQVVTRFRKYPDGRTVVLRTTTKKKVIDKPDATINYTDVTTEEIISKSQS